jgi:hypothetical protein
MAEKCLRQMDSNPPTCSVHNTPVQETHASSPNRSIRHFECRSSGQALKDVIAKSLRITQEPMENHRFRVHFRPCIELVRIKISYASWLVFRERVIRSS